MRRVLIPVDGAGRCHVAVKQVIREFLDNTAMEIHLLNVQLPFSQDIAHFVSKRDRADYHREQAEAVLRPVEQMLDKHGIPYAVHTVTGDRAHAIADAARRLHCDLIVMGTARKNSLTRLVEGSITAQVIELASVPVEVVAGDAISKWERYGIPAAIAAALALVLAVED